MVTASARSLAILALGQSNDAYIVGAGGAFAALSVYSVLRRFVWSSFVLAACALSTWGVRPGSISPWGDTLRGVGTLPSSLRVPGKRLPHCLRGVHSCHAFPGDGLDQGRGPRLPGVPSGAAWCAVLGPSPPWDRAECRVSRGTLGCRLGPVLSPSRRVVGGGGHAHGGRHRSSPTPGVPCARAGVGVRPAGPGWHPAPRLGPTTQHCTPFIPLAVDTAMLIVAGISFLEKVDLHRRRSPHRSRKLLKK